MRLVTDERLAAQFQHQRAGERREGRRAVGETQSLSVGLASVAPLYKPRMGVDTLDTRSRALFSGLERDPAGDALVWARRGYQRQVFARVGMQHPPSPPVLAAQQLAPKALAIVV